MTILKEFILWSRGTLAYTQVGPTWIKIELAIGWYFTRKWPEKLPRQ